MKETRTTEFKETITNSFLKTVSAYANYATGEIIFGISDDGTMKGIDNPEKLCLDIENKINDSIIPVPFYRLEVDEKQSIVRLIVKEGLHKPYLYKSKAYRRNDTATIEVDRLELSRLILEGEDGSFEELPAKNQELTFEILRKKIDTILHLKEFGQDTLKTLELYSDDSGINNAGELLADQNGFCGIDIVRFGDSINIIHDRITLEHQSILKDYDDSIEMYRKYYQYEQIKGAYREKVVLVPEEAFREAIANAIVHRTWDVNTHINVAMFPDRIEITSPGGLPKGMHENEYYRGGISIPGNRIIATIFLRLQMIERFGTGIKRIMETYSNSKLKPTFDIRENSIKIVLPTISENNTLSIDEDAIYSLIKGKVISSSAIIEATKFGKTKVVKILNYLEAEGYIHKIGNGRGTKYTTD